MHLASRAPGDRRCASADTRGHHSPSHRRPAGSEARGAGAGAGRPPPRPRPPQASLVACFLRPLFSVHVRTADPGSPDQQCL